MQIDPAQAVPLLGPLLGISPTEKYPPSPLAPTQKRKQTLALIAEWIERLAHQQPLVLAFEDLHWIDESSLDFLGVLQMRLSRLPVLLVMTTRLEFSAPWPENQTLHLRALEPLPLWEVERMLGALTGGAKLAPALSLLVYERAGGVPLFVEELTRSLIESGQIVEREGQLAPRVPLGELAVPGSLHGLLLARLDRLGVARELIQIAAVIGREVPLRLLLLVAGLDEARLRERLARLVASGLLHGRPDDSYVFKHALIRDSAYETLLKITRERLHGSIAQALATHFPERAAAEPEVLAGHFESARQIDPAVRWYKAAAEKAIAAISMPEAIRHAEHALQLLEQLPRHAKRDLLELDLSTTLGNCRIHVLGYGHPEVAHIFVRASALCEAVDEPLLPCRTLGNIWMMQWHRGEYVQAKVTAERIITLGQRLGDDTVQWMGLMERSWTRLNLGELAECLRDSDQAVQHATPERAESMRRMIGHDGYNFARLPGVHAEWLLGYPDRSLHSIQFTVDRAVRLHHEHSLAWAQFAFMQVMVYRRTPMLALEPGRVCIELNERLGNAEWLAYAQQYLGLSLLMLGRLDEGRTMLDTSNTARRRHHTVGFTTMHKAVEAEQWRVHGQADEARVALAEGFAYMQHSAECHWAAELHRVQGELQLADGDTHAAEASFEQAFAVSRTQGARALELRTATSLARLRQWQGRRQDALALLGPVHAWFTEGLDTPDLQDAAALLRTPGA